MRLCRSRREDRTIATHWMRRINTRATYPTYVTQLWQRAAGVVTEVEEREWPLGSGPRAFETEQPMTEFGRIVSQAMRHKPTQ